MKAAPGESITERIRTVEQRIEHRRQRLREDTHEAKDALHASARRLLPVAAAAGAGLAALWLTRRGRGPLRRSRAAPDDAAAARRGVRWASLLGLASTAYKLGTSPQARLLLAALRRRNARGR